MRNVLLALSASLLAYPAAAQTEETTAAEETSGAAASETVQMESALGCNRNLSAAVSEEAAAATPATEGGSELQSALSEAGFKDVQVLRTSYVMEAIAPNGECLLITVDTAAPGAGMAEGTEAADDVAASAEAEPGTEPAGDQASTDAGEETPTGAAAAEGEIGTPAEELAAGEDEAGLAEQASMGAEGSLAAFGQSSQQITGDFLDSGYTAVRLLDSAYVVLGRAPDGSLVTMSVRSGESAE